MLTSLPRSMRPAFGTTIQTTESGVTRLVHAARSKTRTIRSIMSFEEHVPAGPEEVLLKELGREVPNAIEARLMHLLEERPVWTRPAMMNQLTPAEVKMAHACVFLPFLGPLRTRDRPCLPLAGTSRNAGLASATRSPTVPSATSLCASATTLVSTPKLACASPLSPLHHLIRPDHNRRLQLPAHHAPQPRERPHPPSARHACTLAGALLRHEAEH